MGCCVWDVGPPSLASASCPICMVTSRFILSIWFLTFLLVFMRHPFRVWVWGVSLLVRVDMVVMATRRDPVITSFLSEADTHESKPPHHRGIDLKHGCFSARGLGGRHRTASGQHETKLYIHYIHYFSISFLNHHFPPISLCISSLTWLGRLPVHRIFNSRVLTNVRLQVRNTSLVWPPISAIQPHRY